MPPAPDLANGFTLTNDPLTRDLADAVVFLASDLSVHVTGQVISVDGGQLAHIPTDVTTPGGRCRRGSHRRRDLAHPADKEVATQ